MELRPDRRDTPQDSKRIEIQHVLRECFWGDYQLGVEDILDRLERRNPAFERFLFAKIVENSIYPSKRLRCLFDRQRLLELADDYLQRKPHPTRRLRLIVANLTGRRDLVPEYRWKK